MRICVCTYHLHSRARDNTYNPLRKSRARIFPPESPGYLSIRGRQYRNVVIIMVTPAYRTSKCTVIDNAVDRRPARDRYICDGSIDRQIGQRARHFRSETFFDWTLRKLHGARGLMGAEISDDIIRRCELRSGPRWIYPPTSNSSLAGQTFRLGSTRF